MCLRTLTWLACALWCCSLPVQAALYELTPLDGMAYAINDRGEAAGVTIYHQSAEMPVMFRKGHTVSLWHRAGVPWFPGRGTAINNHGQVAGESFWAFVADRRNGIQHFLSDGPYRTETRVTGINLRGAVVGRCWFQALNGIFAFRYENEIAAPLPRPKHAQGSSALAINDDGVAVGWATVPELPHKPRGPFVQRSVEWRDGKVKLLPSLGEGMQAQANALNNHGDVVGYSQLPSGGFHAFLYRRGTTVDIDDGGNGSTSQATAINDRGQIVGAMTRNGLFKGFVIVDGRMTPLDELLSPEQQALWWVKSAYGINASGQIVAHVISRITGDTQGGLLTPITR